jgi:hypothetical protein
LALLLQCVHFEAQTRVTLSALIIAQFVWKDKDGKSFDMLPVSDAVSKGLMDPRLVDKALATRQTLVFWLPSGLGIPWPHSRALYYARWSA